MLPPGPTWITVWSVLRGSLLPLLVWAGITCFVHFVYSGVLDKSMAGF
ncbi:hypothetical protein [Streptomyces minutiscleroticus]|nr:hypothetical protein [Streptomyces minutiscleroticus]